MSKIVRQLTEQEIELLLPDLREYAKGLAALQRVERMVSLLESVLGIPGLKLDLDTMTLYAPETEEEATTGE